MKNETKKNKSNINLQRGETNLTPTSTIPSSKAKIQHGNDAN
jgi:hypothetical protein